MKKQNKKGFWNLKAFVLAVEVALSICLFLGIFSRPTKITNYNSRNWYFINRGFPIAWAGVSNSLFKVDFPLVKAPFIKILDNYDTNVRFEKVIDLRIFLPLFLIFLLPSYLVTFTLFKIEKENKFLKHQLNVFIVFFTLACLYLYFYWFPRI